MTRPSAEQAERRRHVVRVTRRFFLVYGLLIVLVFLPGLLRTAGLDPLGPAVGAWVARGALVGMVGAVAGYWWWLVSVGEYRMGAGLRFRLLPALLTGEYAIDPENVRRMGDAPGGASPFAGAAQDVAEVHARLLSVGRIPLAEAHVAALREAEAIGRLIEAVDPSAAPERLDAGRAAIAAWQDHLQLLRGALLRGEAPPMEALSAVEADLAQLRAAGDALRQGLQDRASLTPTA